VIFTSDNGGEQYSSMGPFKGKKMTLWEGGIRVPAAVRWPGVVKPGSVSQQPVITMDWSVTMLAAAGVSYPQNWDGISLLPHLKGEVALRSRTFYWRTANRVRAEAFRQGDWKYLHTPEGEYLFNLVQDPSEENNLKDQLPQQFTVLKAAFTEWNQQMLPPLVLVPRADK
jgi:arylsulfatase A-like enzyme